MKLKVFSIYDKKSDSFGHPVYSVSAASILRSFSDVVNSGDDSVISKHPGDFTVFQIAEFDDSTGVFTAAAEMISLGVGSEFLNSSEAVSSEPQA